ncbi:MAG TPA: SRPBCC domain-containing protein, partial [Solirubrobacterales bacterium]|nr:SRPBCC domain-containing protein [Solirubrobacterales bacterium]
MPRVTRRRTVSAAPEQVWRLVSDPYSLPRWWPRTMRVENVDARQGGRRGQWTKVLQTAEGRGVRADYRCVSSAAGERYVWEQQLEGTPFERHLKALRVEVGLRERGGGTEVSLTEEQTLKGMSKLGSPLMRRARGDVLD